MNELELLLASIEEIDREIQATRDQLKSLYDGREALVQQLVEVAKQQGHESGYSNGRYRLKPTKTVVVLDPQGVAQVVPELVKEEVVLKVDTRRLHTVLQTALREQLEPYVREEVKYEVTKETRQQLKSLSTDSQTKKESKVPNNLFED